MSQKPEERNKEMIRYPALIDGEEDAYGVVFPDIDGWAAMGATIDEALVNAEDVLHDYMLETERHGLQLAVPSALEKVAVPEGSTLTTIPLFRVSGKTVRANMTIDKDVLAFIDNEAARRKETRSAYISWMARTMAQIGA